MKHNRIGYTGVDYKVDVEGLLGDCRIFCECKYFVNETVDNKRNAIEYANKIKKTLNSLNMHNRITVIEICGNIKNIILEV